MRCQHCFFWQDINSGAKDLTMEEIEKVARSLPGLIFLRITGGEPFVRKDIADIIGAFYRFSGLRRVGISTNGFLTADIVGSARTMLERLKGIDLEIGISFDGLYEKHDSLRQCKGAFKNAVATFLALKELRKTFPNLRLGFLTTMMKDNQDDFEALFNFLVTLEPDGIGLNLVRGAPMNVSELDVDINKYQSALALINGFNERKISRNPLFKALRFAKTQLSQRIIVKTSVEKRRHVRCNAGRKIAVLYPDGNVSACESSGFGLGNVRDCQYDFRNIWRSEVRRKLVEGIERKKCFCTHECFVTSSLAFEPQGLFRIAGQALVNLAGCGKKS
jgi:MoaA/NifB/PqqE/SkfB family radical SAM enzyme